MSPLAIAMADRHRGRQSLAVCREVSTGTILIKFAPNELGSYTIEKKEFSALESDPLNTEH